MTGQKGLESGAAKAITAAIILDVMLPKMNGWDVLGKIAPVNLRRQCSCFGLRGGRGRTMCGSRSRGADDICPRTLSCATGAGARLCARVLAGRS